MQIAIDETVSPHFLGKGFHNNAHVCDLWLLPNGIPTACEIGTKNLRRDGPHGRWKRNHDGEWHVLADGE